MQIMVDEFLHYGDITMVAVVCHWHHRSIWETPAETASADLSIQFEKDLPGYGLRFEDFWVVFENFHYLSPLVVKLHFEVAGFLNQSTISRFHDVCGIPLSKESYVWHQVEIGPPASIWPLLPLIHKKNCKHQLLEIRVV